MDPTDSDMRLLRTLQQMTEQHHGRPPTMAEVTISLGLPAHSRGNIQRQLSRMRPVYVTWSTSARSLRLTDRGMAVIGTPPRQEQSLAPLSDEILILLASGLTLLAEHIDTGRPIVPPYPEAWQRGMNRLALECLLRELPVRSDAGLPFPGDTPSTIRWCERPLAEWPLRFAQAKRSLDGPLLEDGQPTELCRSIAFRSDAELQACEQAMAVVLGLARQHRTPDAYTAFRKFVIEHPITQRRDLLLAQFSPALGSLGDQLRSLYESVPASTVDALDGRVWCCPACGWTLERRGGRLRCADARCTVLTNEFTCTSLAVAWDPELMRVRRGIRRYVVAPGRYELDLAASLEALGVRVRLWPCFDLYDLHAALPDGTAWAIDVKDWASPYALARELDPIVQAEGLPHQRSFYVIPDRRVADIPNYVSVLRAMIEGSEVHRSLEVITMGDLVERARSLIQKEASRGR